SRGRRPGRRHRRPERAVPGARPRQPAGGAMETLRVALGERSYPIHIGAGLFRPHVGGGSAAIVTNQVVAPLYLPQVREALKGARVTEIVVSDGEQTKGWKVLESVFDALLAARCGRDTLLVALGG